MQGSAFNFRQFHSKLALVISIPLIITIATGIAAPILEDWFGLKNAAKFVVSIHTGKILGLEAIYPVINGLGLLVLLVTGLSMTSFFRKRFSGKKSTP
jgi:hypothetical protein